MAEDPEEKLHEMLLQMDIGVLMQGLFAVGQPSPKRLRELKEKAVLRADTVKLLTQVHLVVVWEADTDISFPHIQVRPDPEDIDTPRIRLRAEDKGVLAQLRLCVDYLGFHRVKYEPDLSATNDNGGYLSFTIPLGYAQKLRGK